METKDAKTIGTEFLEAWTGGNLSAARELLHDDVSFEGPLERLSSADTYLAALEGLAPIIDRIEEQVIFVDGDDVCVVYDMVTDTPAGTQTIAEWYHVRDGRISAVRALFDPRPFLALHPS